MKFLLLILYIFSVSFGPIFMRKGSKNTLISFKNYVLNITVDACFFVGFILYIFGFLLWIIILGFFSPVFISPLTYGITFVVISIFSKKILSEKLTKNELVGVFVILLGVVLLSIS